MAQSVPGEFRKISKFLFAKLRNSVDIDYVGVVIEEGFLVGYGLDYAEQYRYLPGVYRLSI